jgi:putative membrane protein
MPTQFWRITFQIMVSALALIIGDYLMDGVRFDHTWVALITAVVIALLNTFLKPVLVLLTIPATIVTFGLFLLVINAVILLIAREIVPGFHIAGFWTAILLALLISFMNTLLGGNVKVQTSRTNRDEF